MGKKIMKRSLVLSALMAFVITGSAMAGPEYLQVDNFDSITLEKTITHGYRNVLVYQTIDNADVTVDKNVEYKYYVTTENGNQSSESKVLAQSGTPTDKNVTFNKNVSVYLSTDSVRNKTGKGSVFGIDVWQGMWKFNGETNVEVNSNGGTDGTAMNATGVRFWGNGAGETAVGSFNGKTVIKVTGVDASDGTGAMAGLPGFNTGVYVGTDSTIVASDEFRVDVQSTGQADNGGSNESATAYGITVVGGAATFNGTTEILSTSKQGQAYGLSVKSDGYTPGEGNFRGEAQVAFAGDTNINVTGAERAVGVNAEESSDAVNASLTGDNITIKATADELARGVVAKNAVVTLGGEKSNITITLDGGNQLLSDGSSNPSIGIWAWKENAKVVVNGQSLTIDGIVRNNGDMYGIIAQTTNLGNNDDEKSKVVVDAQNTYINIVDESGKVAGSAIVAMSEGQLEMNGNVYASAKNAVVARGNSTLGINTKNDENKTIQLDGDIYFAYATNSGSTVDAAVDINLANADSYLTGKIVADSEPPADGKVTGMNLGVSNKAKWNVTGDSFVNNLALKENGAVNLLGEGKIVNVLNSLESNKGVVNTDNLSHKIVVAENATTNISSLTVKGTQDIADVMTEDNKQDTLEKLADVVYKEGATGHKVGEYSVATQVYTPEGAVIGETWADVKDGDIVEDSIEEKVNTKNQAIGDAGISLKLHWRAHMNDMNKRMGELRNAEGEHGVWARMVRGESEYKNTKAQYNQYQLGYDEKLSVDKRWTVGAAVTFAEGDANYGQGSTDDKSTAFAIYGSKLNNDGTFVDLIARYAHLESDLDDANSGKGDYATNGMSVSAEFGKRIQHGNGLWIEPQVELTYGTIDSAEFKFDSGKAVQVGDMDSLIGRVGFRIGKDLEQGNVYARASYLYDFDGETENAFSNATDSRTIAEDLGGGWWEVGVGANINLSKATYVYADVEKTFGGEVDTNWQWNLGVRYSF